MMTETTFPEHDEPDSLTQEEEADLEAAEPEAKPIAYSGQDFDVDGLIRRLNNEDILVPNFGHDDEKIQSAGFQRAFVWRRPQMDKFIESILLGYPIPGVFLVKQSDARYLVLDGQQRLLTLKFFKDGLYQGREFALKNVQNDLKGLTYKTLPDDLRRIFENTFIQAIVVTSDGSAQSLDSIYQIFERLNSGGTQLTPHEIRVALYAGPFIDFLEIVNSQEAWRELYGKRSPRLRDQELILRIIALLLRGNEYRRPLKKFLNDTTAENRNNGEQQLEYLRSDIDKASQLILKSCGRQGLRLEGSSQVNAALAEAIFVGLIVSLDSKTSTPQPHSVRETIEQIKRDEKMLEAISKATADESQVNLRISIASDYFGGI